jgi:hypothetical protein
MTAIAPVYIKLTHRFVTGVGPKSLAKLAEDTGITVPELTRFDETKELEPEKVIKIWQTLFGNATFLEASAQLDALEL